MQEPIEKVHKHFMDFEKEEAWLQQKLNAGWILSRYRDEIEEGTYYTFEHVRTESQKQRVYKIDFREFDEKEEYKEYIDMFSESGWMTLSEQKDAKHIFYTDSANVSQHIFSDEESYKEREQRMIQSTLKNSIIYFGFFIVSIVLYVLFDKAFFIGAGLFSAFATVKSLISYVAHKKILKSMNRKAL